MANLKELRDERLRKLGELRNLGINAYPAKANRTHKMGDIVVNFDSLEGDEATVAGRIVGVRKFGKLAFIVLKDASGQLQLFLKDGIVAPTDAQKSQIGLEHLNLLDTGDFIEATGPIIKSKTGEISIEVQSLRLLTKSLRPMPTAQDGFTNKEERMRRRYVDMNVNEDVRQRFIRRSAFWQATREFLLNNNFTEINVPVLEHTTGGADANPFVTHMDALDQDFYLRISHELPLKRLLGAGFEKVFDIGPRFRNENYSDEHLPEHIAMEWYWAYADWEDGMKFMEDMFKKVLESAFGTLQFSLDGKEIDMSKPWEKWDYATVIRDHYGLEVFDCTIDEVKAALKKHGLEVEKTENISRGIDKLWKKVRATVAGPVWLINTPLFISPLSKADDKDPRYVQRFQAVIAGSELCNGWSELNDPVDQLGRFLEQQNMRDSGDDEAQMLDIDYVEMLEYGMPPACGLGFSERVFWIFEGVTAREGVPFPQLRSEVDETTKSLYPDVNFEAPKTTKKVDTKSLPVSAAQQGTKKLYLSDPSLLNFNAKVESLEDLGEGEIRVILDQTSFYPGGGGQDFDLGSIQWEGGSLTLSSVSKTKEGIVWHDGTFEGTAPVIGTAVSGQVDKARRLLNSRLHCAGHLIDRSLELIGKPWPSGKGAHYPHMSFVEYSGDFDFEEADQLSRQIEEKLLGFSNDGGAITVKEVPSTEARELSKYIPEVVLQSYQNVHLAVYPGDFYICCGGTHLGDVSELGEVKITKIKKKNGNIRISYELA